MRRWFGLRLSLPVNHSAFGSRGSKALHHELGSRSQKAASLFHQSCSSSDHSSPLSVHSSEHSSPLSDKDDDDLKHTKALFHTSSQRRRRLPLLSLFSVHTRFLSSKAPPPWPASFSGPTPLLGVPPLSLPIGRADTPSARQRDRWAFPQLCLADSLPDLS